VRSPSPNEWARLSPCATAVPAVGADDTPIERQASECDILLPQGEGHTPVILGEGDDQALLGVVTLEILGLVFNPFFRTLQPMKGLLA
jgi:hypothetical protein